MTILTKNGLLISASDKGISQVIVTLLCDLFSN